MKVPSSSDTALTESQGEESVASVNGNVDEPKRLDVAAEDAALVDSKLPKPKSRFTVKAVPKEVYINNEFIRVVFNSILTFLPGREVESTVGQ